MCATRSNITPAAIQAGQRLITAFGSILAVLNGVLVAGSGALALVLWRHGKVEVGAIAMVLPLTYQLTAMSRWIALRHHRHFRRNRRRAGGHDVDRACRCN